MGQEDLTSKIENCIKKSELKPALIPFIVSGYPDFQITKNLLRLFEQKNAAAIELGIPFSDPLADGPVIQKASKAALENGVNINKIFNMLSELKDDFNTPIILFTYYNPVLNFGVENFITKAAELNIKGLIIPDLPLEESEQVLKLAKDNEIDLIMLVSPTSDEERIEKISKASSGFIYLVSSMGVTGVRETFSSQLGSILKKIKSFTATPVAVGFGVSRSEHIKEIRDLNADAAIIGSAIVKIIDEYKADEALLLSKMEEYLDSLYI
jgi:tryptophan synthase alpha chain